MNLRSLKYLGDFSYTTPIRAPLPVLDDQLQMTITDPSRTLALHGDLRTLIGEKSTDIQHSPLVFLGSKCCEYDLTSYCIAEKYFSIPGEVFRIDHLENSTIHLAYTNGPYISIGGIIHAEILHRHKPR